MSFNFDFKIGTSLVSNSSHFFLDNAGCQGTKAQTLYQCVRKEKENYKQCSTFKSIPTLPVYNHQNVDKLSIHYKKSALFNLFLAHSCCLPLNVSVNFSSTVPHGAFMHSNLYVRLIRFVIRYRHWF